jgi:hypothetical protein
MRNRAIKLVMWAALVMGIGASPATALTIGQTSATPTTCQANLDVVPQSVASGPDYVVPNVGGILNWTLTSWSTRANSTPGSLALKVWRPLGGQAYQVVAHDGPHALSVNTGNTFNTSLAMTTGDVLGLHNVDRNVGCGFDTGDPADVLQFGFTDLADRESVTFSIPGPGLRANISAEIEPTNTFTQSALTLNKKKGDATVRLNVPNPGSLAATGNGITSSAATVTAPGPASLILTAQGKKRRKLNATGKVSIAATVTYTPTGGAPNSLPVTLKLKKQLKKK